MSEFIDDPEDYYNQLDDLLIMELDERLEFGVAALSSVIAYDSNTACANPSGCTNGSCPNATNQSNCHNGSGC